ncbi:hypothetical protein [Pseudonocardia sp. KRD291]|uniref:hypothetical protein n=1 Tax=Pseudonocardia sp. KRD291 TaxID=2792007 RepID=UPI001C4A416C|nr:hypothetical protein [Pseudonocardia sp. KRD291]MBW0101637.1 hypothetical protein [Pseudonocardia sp. KRD291]
MAVEWQAGWVVPSLAEVRDLGWLARWRHLANSHPCDAAYAEGVGAAIAWVQGSARVGPATARSESPLTRQLVTAEMWAAMALNDGGGTSERTLRGVCAVQGVAYVRPDFERATLDHGSGIYRTLGWLIGNGDGWRGGRVPPYEIPARDAAGNVAADPRSRELVELIERTRAADVAMQPARRR